MPGLTMADVRSKFPQYSDMSDDQLAGALHQKFYADMPQDQFYSQIGYKPTPAAPEPGVRPIAGALELAGSGIANIPHAALHAGVDLYRRLTGGDTNAPDPRAVSAFQVPVGQAGRDLVSSVANSGVGQAMGKGLHSADEALGNFSPTLQDVVHETGGVASDIAGLAPGASLAKLGASALTGGAEGAASIAEQAGMRTAENHTIARNIAGHSGKEALTATNQPIANRIAANQVGHVGDTLTSESLTDARAPASAVWNRVANALPEGPLSPTAQKALETIGGEGVPTGTKNSAENINGLKSNLMEKGTWKGQDVISTLRDLRQKAISNMSSDVPDSQEFGKVQMNAARALEQHVSDTLPPDADVSLDQFKAARQNLAQSHTVQEALKGGDVDMQALARLHRNEPGMLTGGLKALAEFGDQHPEVASLPTKDARYNPPGLAKDVASMDLKSPLSWVRPVVGGAARKVLTGVDQGVPEATDRMFPLQSATKFDPIPPAPLPEGTIPGPGPSGGTPLLTLGDHLGVNPAGVPPAAPPAAHTLADVLSTGVEQPPAPGLSLSEMGSQMQPEGLPFKPDAEHMAGGLSLADSISPPHESILDIQNRLRVAAGKPPIEAQDNPPHVSILDEVDAKHKALSKAATSDLASVLSQGVPEGIVQKAAPSFAYRGVEPGADARTPRNRAGALFYAPDQSSAGEYGSLVDKAELPSDVHDAGSIMDLLSAHGIDPARAGHQEALMEALSNYAGKPGAKPWLKFKYPFKGDPEEFVHFPKLGDALGTPDG